jgi:hypothetical protein
MRAECPLTAMRTGVFLMDEVRRYELVRFWLCCLGLALCVIFVGLAVFGASVPVILCVGFPVLIVSIWFLYWELYVTHLDLPNWFREIPAQLGSLIQVSGVVPPEVPLLWQITEQLKKITEMAEFVGEQSSPNFANKVKTFEEVQEELAAVARFVNRASQWLAMRQAEKQQSESQEKAAPTKADTKSESG